MDWKRAIRKGSRTMIEPERLVAIYRTMNRIRTFEEKALALFEANQLRGSVHLCIGQEAIPSTVSAPTWNER
jgi:pyruvate dehydrogenase E1 component alpha subunit